MSTLDSYPLQYEDLTPSTRKGGKDSKMSKEVKPEVKTTRKYSKTRGEHFKDIVITILVTAIVAFVAGTMFANKQQARIDRAVQAVTPTAEAAQLK